MKCITKMANEYLKNKRTTPMTAEQLEELLGKVTPDWCVYSEPEVGLYPSLFAGRVGVQPKPHWTDAERREGVARDEAP